VTHAEVLGLVVIAQLIAPHVPVVYGMSSSVPDMKTGLNLAGAVEIGLARSGVVQLAGRIGIPCSVSSGIDADLPGPQSVLERMMTALPPILAGADLINLCANDGKLTFSPEQLVIDDEIMRWVGHYLRGMRVDEESMALELIHAVGPGGTFVGKAHTARHLRQALLVEGLIRGQSTDPAGDLTSKPGRKHERFCDSLPVRMRAGNADSVPAGDHFQMGLQHGQQVHNLRPLIVATIDARLAGSAQRSSPEGRLLQELEQAWMESAHSTMDMLRGIAEGLELPFPRLFHYAAASYLDDVAQSSASADARSGRPRGQPRAKGHPS
jgi:hypothetical protein